MMQKKMIGFLGFGTCLLCAGLVLSACASAPGQVKPGKEKSVSAQSWRTSATGAKVKNPQFLEIGAYRKVLLAESVFEGLELDKELAVDEKLVFIEKLFDQLPINASINPVREIAVKNYYENGKPLRLRISILQVPVAGNTKAKRVMVVQSDAVRVANIGQLGGLMRGQGEFRNLDFNQSWMWLDFGQGIIASYANLVETQGNPDLANADSLEKVNACDFLLKDEVPGNDGQVPALLDAAQADTTAIPEVALTARLNRILWFLSRSDPESAGTALIELREALGPEAKADFQMALDNQAAPMVDLMKQLVEKAQ